MSTPKDMAECEMRNGEGYPFMCAHPGAAITSSSIDASHGKNEKLPWVAFSWFLSGAALMGVVMMPMVIESKVRAGSAKAEANSELALKTAYTAKDQIDVWISRQKAKEGQSK